MLSQPEDPLALELGGGLQESLGDRGMHFPALLTVERGLHLELPRRVGEMVASVDPAKEPRLHGGGERLHDLRLTSTERDAQDGEGSVRAGDGHRRRRATRGRWQGLEPAADLVMMVAPGALLGHLQEPGGGPFERPLPGLEGLRKVLLDGHEKDHGDRGELPGELGEVGDGSGVGELSGVEREEQRTLGGPGADQVRDLGTHLLRSWERIGAEARTEWAAALGPGSSSAGLSAPRGASPTGGGGPGDGQEPREGEA